MKKLRLEGFPIGFLIFQPKCWRDFEFPSTIGKGACDSDLLQCQEMSAKNRLEEEQKDLKAQLKFRQEQGRNGNGNNYWWLNAYHLVPPTSQNGWEHPGKIHRWTILRSGWDQLAEIFQSQDAKDLGGTVPLAFGWFFGCFVFWLQYSNGPIFVNMLLCCYMFDTFFVGLLDGRRCKSKKIRTTRSRGAWRRAASPFVVWFIPDPFFPKASPMLGFSFSLLEGGVERGLTGPWCGRDVWWWSGMGVIRDGCDTGWVWYGVWWVWYGVWWVCDRRWRERDGVWTGVDGGEDGRWRERDGVWMGVDGWGWKMEGSETGCGRVWTVVRMEDGGERDGVWTDGRWRGARRGVDGCGRWWGWKMEGSETGCGRVWTGVRMEEGGERDGVWTGVDGGEDGRWGERDGVWTDGRWRGARRGVDGCGRWWGWKMEGSETGCGRVWTRVRMEDGGEWDGVWTGVRMEDGGERDGVWTGVDQGEDGRWRGARQGVDGGEDGRWSGARRGVDGCGRWWGWKMEGSEAGCGRGRGWKMEGSETVCGWVWGWKMEGARRGVDGCGRGWGWKMEGSETGGGEILKKIKAEGAADGHDSGGKEVDRGRGRSMCQG